MVHSDIDNIKLHLLLDFDLGTSSVLARCIEETPSKHSKLLHSAGRLKRRGIVVVQIW